MSSKSDSNSNSDSAGQSTNGERAEQAARAPLQAQAVLAEAEGQTGLRERPLLAQVRVQCVAMDEALQQALRERLGELPRPGYFVEREGRRIHWLGPKEFLVIMDRDCEAMIIDRLADLPVKLSIISDSRVTLSLSGEQVAMNLAQHCALDLHSEVFAVGCSTVTRLAGLAAMVSRVGECEYEVSVDRACGGYLWGCLGGI